MNRKLFLFALGVFLLFSMSGFVLSAETNYSTNYDYDGVQITLLKYEPDVVNPVEYFDVWIHASLGSKVDYAKFELMDSFPFSIDESEDSIREYEGESISSREVVMHYKVRVSEDAVEGVNELKLGVTTYKLSNSADFVKTFDVSVEDVQTNFDLVIQDSSSSEISLAIANVGKNTANSMIVRVPSQDSYKVSGTNGQMVGNLDSGDYTIVSFEVAKTSRSEDPLLVQIDYTDSIGERRSLTKEIDFDSGSMIGDANVSGGLPSDMRGNFSRQQTQTAKWPYVLAGIIILGGVILFFYQKDSRKFKRFFMKIKKSEEKDKSEKLNFPDWMKKEKEKTKR